MSAGRSTWNSDRVARYAMFAAIACAIWVWGVVSVIGNMFPYPQLRSVYYDSRTALAFLGEQSGLSLPLYYTPGPGHADKVRKHLPGEIAPGLILVSQMGPDATQTVQLMDSDAVVMHEWRIDWFDLWPEPDHLDARLLPRSRPGTSVHGLALMPNGDIVFNFENLGMMRVDFCGRPVWRLPYQTHHSVYIADDGNIWAAGKIDHTEPDPAFPNHVPPFDEFTVVEISPAGEILTELSLPRILEANGLAGLLYMSTRNNYGTRVGGDTLHLNDVEVFPDSLGPGVFRPGDVMLSVRNLNAIFVIDPESLEIRFMSIGAVLRQHDPDFVDGNTITVFDNNNLSPDTVQASFVRRDIASRIVAIDAVSGKATTIYEGSADSPFFTDIMGKHQHLPGGNTMINSAREGRSFEITPDGRIAWEYFNHVGDGLVGLVDDTQKLGPDWTVARIASLAGGCGAR